MSAAIKVYCTHSELVDVIKLVEHPNNPNKHDDRQINLLARIIKAQGWRNPITVSNKSGYIISGHGRLAAAKVLNETKVPVDYQDFENEAEELAHLLADNRIAELAELDFKGVESILNELREHDFDLDLTGFDELSIEELFPDEPIEQDENETPSIDRGEELRSKWKTDDNQIWSLGKHFLMCGDCRDKKSVSKLFSVQNNNELKATVAWTSPPYASQRKYDESSGFKPVQPDEYIEWFKQVSDNVASYLTNDGSWFVNIKEHCEDGQRHLYVKDLTIAHVREWDWKFIEEYVWTHGGTPKAVVNRFKNGWEPVFHFAKGKFKFNRENVMHKIDASSSVNWGGRHPSMNDGQGLTGPNLSKNQGVNSDIMPDAVKGLDMAYPSNVLKMGKNTEALGHGAASPITLPSFFIKAYSDENDIIYEPFNGSGTTLMASENEKRRCLAMEISPAYVAITLERFKDATGITPTLVV
jgi:DNA modification methylase